MRERLVDLTEIRNTYNWDHFCCSTSDSAINIQSHLMMYDPPKNDLDEKKYLNTVSI